MCTRRSISTEDHILMDKPESFCSVPMFIHNAQGHTSYLIFLNCYIFKKVIETEGLKKERLHIWRRFAINLDRFSLSNQEVYPICGVRSSNSCSSPKYTLKFYYKWRRRQIWKHKPWWAKENIFSMVLDCHSTKPKI